MLGFNKTVGQLDMANSVRCYPDALRIEDGHVLRMSLDFMAVSQ